MSFQYPIIIEDEPHLCRLIRQIAKEVAKELPGKEPPLMTKQDCYNEVGRRMTDEAIASGALKLSAVQGRVKIKRIDFINWINNENPKRR